MLFFQVGMVNDKLVISNAYAFTFHHTECFEV